MLTKASVLPPAEVSKRAGSICQPGKPIMWVVGFGWGLVGYHIRNVTPIRSRVAHCNFFRNAGKDYGALAREGGGKDCEWRYLGNVEITMPHVIFPAEYNGLVPHNANNTDSGRMLSHDQVEKFSDTLYKPGKALMWVLSFGWAHVGYFIEESPVNAEGRKEDYRIRVSHTNFFRNAGKDYGALAREGGGKDCEWRYLGETEISKQHILFTVEYLGEVPTKPIKSKD